MLNKILNSLFVMAGVQVQIMHSLLFTQIYKKKLDLNSCANIPILLQFLLKKWRRYFLFARGCEFFKCCDGLHVNKCPCAIVIAAEYKIPSLHVVYRHYGYLFPFCLLSCWKALYEVPKPSISPLPQPRCYILSALVPPPVPPIPGFMVLLDLYGRFDPRMRAGTN